MNPPPAGRADLQAKPERKRPSDFIDVSLLKELETENFFSRLYR